MSFQPNTSAAFSFPVQADDIQDLLGPELSVPIFSDLDYYDRTVNLLDDIPGLNMDEALTLIDDCFKRLARPCRKAGVVTPGSPSAITAMNGEPADP